MKDPYYSSMNSQWMLEAMVTACQDRLSDMESRLQLWLEIKLGLYKPSPWDNYFSRQMLENCIDGVKLGELAVDIKPLKRKTRIRFFKRSC